MLNNSEKLINEIATFLKKKGFEPQVMNTRKPACRLKYVNNSLEYTCYIAVEYEISTLLFYFIPPIKVEEDDLLLPVAEYVTRANYGMLFGNFEMDFSDGEVRYKKTIAWRETPVAMSEILDALESGVSMWGMYLPGLMLIIYEGVSPEEAIDHLRNPR